MDMKKKNEDTYTHTHTQNWTTGKSTRRKLIAILVKIPYRLFQSCAWACKTDVGREPNLQPLQASFHMLSLLSIPHIIFIFRHQINSS